MTGVGMLTSVGIGTEPVWQAIKEGRSGIGPITAFDATEFSCRIAGEVKGFVSSARDRTLQRLESLILLRLARSMRCCVNLLGILVRRLSARDAVDERYFMG